MKSQLPKFLIASLLIALGAKSDRFRRRPAVLVVCGLLLIGAALLGSTEVWAGIQLPGRLEAENFNAGGQNVGYYVPGNSPVMGSGTYSGCGWWTIRCNESVSISRTGNFGGGWYVQGDASGSEWLQYDVNFAQSGSYNVAARIASVYDQGTATYCFHLNLDGKNVTGPVTFLGSANSSTWNAVSVPFANVVAGAHTIQLFFDHPIDPSNNYNFLLDYIDFTLPAQTAPPSVTITSPAPQSSAQGTITLNANASSPYGIAGVQFKVDALPLGPELTTPPYTTTLDTTQLDRGAHLIAAVARDTAGNSAYATVWPAVFVMRPEQPLVAPPAAIVSSPSIFFTDLESGPNTGGQNNNGAFVAIYGKNFGSSRGTASVTVGNGTVAAYPVWGQNNAANPNLDMIVVQLGPAAQTGNIVVHTANGNSNPLPFTVRSGNIYFVSPTGNDGNAGTIGSPWGSLSHARQTLQPGDIAYVRGGQWTSPDCMWLDMICLGDSPGGNPGQPKAYVGYPGEQAILDATNLNPNDWARPKVFSAYNGSGYITISNFTMRANGLNIASNGNGIFGLRIVGCDMTTTLGAGGASGADVVGAGGNHAFYGNNIYRGASTDLNCDDDWTCSGYSIYLGASVPGSPGALNGTDIGWNILHDNPVGKGVQVYGHTLGDVITGIKIHDNAIYNNGKNGLSLGGGDGGSDPLQDATIYNNLIFNNGAQGYGAKAYPYPGIGFGSQGSTGNYYFYNNTLFNNGAPHGQVAAGSELQIANGVNSATFKNNIFYANGAASTYAFAYVCSWCGINLTAPNLAGFSGSNNLFFGASVPTPTWEMAPILKNPQFVNSSSYNFEPAPSSPAIKAGMNLAGSWPAARATDIQGTPRPTVGAWSIGAYEFISNGGILASPPARSTGFRLQ